MPNKEWFTFQAGPRVVIGDTPHEQHWFQDLDIAGIRVNPGDVITHFLLDYWWTTALYENALELQLAPWPLVVGAGYSPEPNGMATWTAQSDQGDALVTTGATWEPQSWTDGTTHSTRWIARSTQPLYSNTSRTLQGFGDHVIRLSAGLQFPFEFSGDTSLWFLPDCWGWVRLRALVNEKSV